MKELKVNHHDGLQLPLSVVIRSGRDLDGLLRCISSIDVGVEIIASIARDADFICDLYEYDIIVALHDYGNWSVAAQCGIDVASHSHVVIMDGSDSVFAPGSLKAISDALTSGHLIVQPNLVFKTNSSRGSQLIANARMHENRFEPKSYSPGLGLNKDELQRIMGVNGNVYDINVAYGDDGALDQRRRNAGINVFVAENAIIYHDPIEYNHEIKNSYQFGVGERQDQEEKKNPKNLANIIHEEFMSKRARDYYLSAYKNFGLSTMMFVMFSRLEYIRGFVTENIRLKRQ